MKNSSYNEYSTNDKEKNKDNGNEDNNSENTCGYIINNISLESLQRQLS